MEARRRKKLPSNVEGKYFTTEDCDGCAYCASVAPGNFDYEKKSNTYFVAKQPADVHQEESMQEAKEDCPLDAIDAHDECSI